MAHEAAYADEMNLIEENIISIGSFKKKSLQTLPISMKDYRYNEIIPGLIIASPIMADLALKLKIIAATDSNVLLHGETGTGKELFAHAIHKYSRRAADPFVIVDCCTLSKEIEDSELFGHLAGSFTGATSTRTGLLEMSNSGTVFLDEISELSMSQQGKLLRFIESKTIRRVGASKYTELDVRIIAASNKDLVNMVRNGTFREDLFHRLNCAYLRLPSLDERPEDIPVLSAFFLNKLGINQVSFDFPKKIKNHLWRGNVRELKQTMERSSIFFRRGNTLTDLEITYGDYITDDKDDELNLNILVKKHVQKVLDMHDGCQKKAAKDLGITERVLCYKVKALNLIGSAARNAR
jgi:transcriptional regulator with PAS, ATPase and Fis domain